MENSPNKGLDKRSKPQLKVLLLSETDTAQEETKEAGSDLRIS